LVEDITSGNGRTLAHLAPVLREVSVLAVDLVGSTRLVERLDPAAAAAVFDAYLRDMTSLAQAHGGTIGSIAGDGLPVVFGAPEPLSPAESARRAVAAASAMRARAPQIARDLTGEPLAVRVAVNTGRCAVGAFGGDDHRTYTAIGSPVHLVARLEATAEPDEILLGPRTRELVDGCEAVARGPVALKGFEEPVSAYALGRGAAG